MPTTLRNTDILFNDGTTLSTAAGAVTTASVLNATAGASAGAVGSYMFASSSTASDVAFGSTRAGSALGPISAAYYVNTTSGQIVGLNGGSAQAGTWRAMGTYDYTSSDPYSTLFGATLWLRIS